jgi:hypothetical protein
MGHGFAAVGNPPMDSGGLERPRITLRPESRLSSPRHMIVPFMLPIAMGDPRLTMRPFRTMMRRRAGALSL